MRDVAVRSTIARVDRLGVHALRLSLPLVLAFGVGTFAFHLATAGQYGYQRDEMYFIACSKRLAWGYVDQPPMIALIARAAITLFGQSLYALRIFPALAAGLIVVLTGQLCRRLGGGTVAQCFAMLAVVVAPFYLAVGNLLTMNAFEPLTWTAAAYLIIELLDEHAEPQRRRWPLLGLVLACGILTKYTAGFFAVALLITLIVLPQRRLLRSPGIWTAIAIVLALTAPNLRWQQDHAWPQIQLLQSAVVTKNVELGPLAFFLSQIMMMNPLTFPVWAAGLIEFARGYGGRYRVFAGAYAVLFVVYIALRAKIYYLAPIYPLLFAAGACVLERGFLADAGRRIAYASVLALVSLLILPQVIPLLPLPAFLAYQRFIDFRQIKEEDHAAGRVPQQYADMLGWDQLVERIAMTYNTLPPARRARAAIWTENYGEAAAVDLLGRRYGLPDAISGHNNYFLWGPRGYDGSTVITVGVPPNLSHAEFRNVRHVATFTNPYVMPYQNNIAIDLCTRPIEPLAAFWPRVKAYY